MHNKYDEATERKIEDIQALFVGGYNTLNLEVSVDGDGYHLKASRMYEYPEFERGSFLTNVGDIARILGCKEGDEESRNSYSGCDTCGYGSSYEIEWKFWN